MAVNPLLLLLPALSYSYVLGTLLPRGFLRVVSLIPTFYLFYQIPWYFPYYAVRWQVSLDITCLSSFKLLLFCFDRGPLAATANFTDFAVLTIFPAKLRQDQKDQDGDTLRKNPSPSSVLWLKLSAVLLLQLLVHTFIDESGYSAKSLFALYGTSLLVGTYAVQKCHGLFVHAVRRYEMIQILKSPHRAKSIQEFWGRRWNRMSSDILRQAVYDPTRETLMGLTGNAAARLVAVVATFVVSALMHELMYYYATCGMKTTWTVSWFFALQGFAIAVETLLQQQKLVVLHPTASYTLRMAFMSVSFMRLLLLPVIRNGRNRCD